MRHPIFIRWIALEFALSVSLSISCIVFSATGDSLSSNVVSTTPVDLSQSSGAFARTRQFSDALRKRWLNARSLFNVSRHKSDPRHVIPVPLSRPKAEIIAESTLFAAEPTPDARAKEISTVRESLFRAGSIDSRLQRVQATPPEPQVSPSHGSSCNTLAVIMPDDWIPLAGGQSISLQAALYDTLTSNPDLATLRLGNPTTPSAEAVEVARHFPATLNPTLWCDLRPITLIPPDPFGGGGQRTGSFYKFGQFYFYLSLRQPIELGHQTTYRYNIAKAAHKQQRWTIVQAELLALVQTYRFFQTAVYRRERLKVARELADFSDRLSRTLEHQLEANQVPAADVILSKVESRATRQLVKAAQQDYVTALTDLRNQIGGPESSAAEPIGEFTLPPYIPPAQAEDLIEMALQHRADIQGARAVVDGTKAAEKLASADRIPSPVIGPQFAIDEAGIQYIGLVYISPIPIWNCGGLLLRQREADHLRAHLALENTQHRAVAQVRSSMAKWKGASELVKATSGLTSELAHEVSNLEFLFDQGQTDLSRLMQAKQRLIQLRTTEVDAMWSATQAQADLLLSIGVPALIHGMLRQIENVTAVSPMGSSSMPAPTSLPPATSPSPFGTSGSPPGAVVQPVKP